MIGNGIKQTTTTTGTGNLTLSAVTGYPKFSDVFQAKHPFSYTLLDSNGLFKEAGIGYLDASGALVRSRVSATFDSGVYNKTNPTALALTGTTTVICSPHAGTTENPIPTLAPYNEKRLLSANRTANVSTGIWGIGRLYYVPFLLRTPGVVVGMSGVVATQQAGGAFRGAMYTQRVDGHVGELLCFTGAMDATTPGTKYASVGTPIFLPAGQYYMGIYSYGAAANISATSYVNSNASSHITNILGYLNAAVAPLDCGYETLSTTETPFPQTASDSLTYIGIGQGTVPGLWLWMQ